MADCQECSSRLNGLFRHLSPETLKELSLHKTTNRFRKGQKIFQEGAPATGLFCMSSGKCKLMKSGWEGNEVIIRLYHAGDILGYRSLLTNEPYGATAAVIEDSLVCFIDRHFFRQLIAKEPDLAFRLFNRLGMELAEAQDRIRDLANKTVRQRLGEILLTLRKVYGRQVTEGVWIDIALSRVDLASMINATPETVIRTLSEFRNSGCVRLEGKRIIITDVDALAEESNLSY